MVPDLVLVRNIDPVSGYSNFIEPDSFQDSGGNWCGYTINSKTTTQVLINFNKETQSDGSTMVIDVYAF